MEFRCSKCGHIGPAEEVRPTDGGVEVVCAECGMASPIDASSSNSTDEPSDDRAAPDGEDAGDAVGAILEGFGDDGAKSAFDASETKPGDDDTFDARPSRTKGGAGGSEMRLAEEEALDRLVPAPGEGERCPKCAKLLSANLDHCPRCGVDVEEAREYESGDAPWEQAAAGREQIREQAELLWSSFSEERDPEKLDKFVEFVEEEGLYEMAIRRLRFFLVDEPESEPALEALRRLAVGVQSRVVTARAQAEVNAEEFNEEIESFKRKLIGAVIVIWTLTMILFIQLFW